jgi:hypothetical protein
MYGLKPVPFNTANFRGGNFQGRSFDFADRFAINFAQDDNLLIYINVGNAFLATGH